MCAGSHSPWKNENTADIFRDFDGCKICTGNYLRKTNLLYGRGYEIRVRTIVMSIIALLLELFYPESSALVSVGIECERDANTER
jgi:hypothetical protein